MSEGLSQDTGRIPHEAGESEEMGLHKPVVAILAAGEGRRLWRNGDRASKLSTALLESSLGEWNLRGFAAAGLSRFLVALGSHGAAVREHYEAVSRRLGCQVSFIEVEDWHRGNGVSALAAARAGSNSGLITASA